MPPPITAILTLRHLLANSLLQQSKLNGFCRMKQQIASQLRYIYLEWKQWQHH
jgi:hypothetical protein